MSKRIPNTYVLLFLIIILIGIMSYIIPSGSFDRYIDSETGISYVVPDSYEQMPKSYLSVFKIFESIPEGMMQAGNIIIFVLIAGGSFGIIQSTGTINRIIENIVVRYGGKEKKIIPLVMIIFSLAGAVFGTAEEALPFYPMFISLSLALGFDRLTGVAMVLLGTGSGFVAGFLNPFTTGIAQNISQLPLFSGMYFRIIAYIVFVSTSIIFVYRYANKVKSEKIDSDENYEFEEEFNFDNLSSLNSKHVRVTIVILLFFIFLLVGVIKYNFYITEISTTFLMMGIISGLVGGFNSGRIVSEFIKGASNQVYGALIIGLAKSVMVVMEYGQIMDTVIYALSKVISGVGPIMGSIGMFISQTLINLFVTSGSGQAAVTMPIMKTLADFSGVSRQTAVLAFQFGDGFTNVLSPTSGYFMAALAIGGISWRKWTKWMMPLFIIWVIEGCILLVISSIIGYGPF
ncbi:YfcC family protein [Clostridium sp. D2Q-11]|uniref:YfcC family protein n=1 Tax=Anaeromonas frigoriresistens TaxID=2683708 RepID=A0A942Z8C1_9FIRM|nr:TIGR00366 family protein [Anaeromonas frigoriresistens]MBS4538133.1 YfcC family protein [Anaeromonas frigoriresistens]